MGHLVEAVVHPYPEAVGDQEDVDHPFLEEGVGVVDHPFLVVVEVVEALLMRSLEEAGEVVDLQDHLEEEEAVEVVVPQDREVVLVLLMVLLRRKLERKITKWKNWLNACQ